MNEEFKYLSESAFDFFISSIREIDLSPKHSLIYFYSGIEILLKARLFYIDWKLIVPDPYDVSYDDFKKGKFKAINLDKAIRRINKFTDDNISDKAKDSFIKISRHRNKIIHFYNPQFIDKTKSKIAIEQWVAWHYLQELLEKKWKNIFIGFDESIKFINSAIRNHMQFLENKYSILKDSINSDIKNGTQYRQCNVCGFESSKMNTKERYGSIYFCRICEAGMTIIDVVDITINCPHCNKIYYIVEKNEAGIKIIDYPYDFSRKNQQQICSKIENIYKQSKGKGVCSSCHKTISTKNVIEQCYKKYTPETYAWYEDEMPQAAYCCTCQHDEPSVFYIKDQWTCVICFDKGWTALDCPHCNEFVVGDTNKINYYACVRCEENIKEP